MSSSAYLTFDEPISRDDWLTFCREYDLVYRPNVHIQNVFQVGSVQGMFGERGTRPMLRPGQPDWDRAEPPTEAVSIDVKTTWMDDLEGVACITAAIWLRWGGRLAADPEIKLALLSPDLVKCEPEIVDGSVVGHTVVDDQPPKLAIATLNPYPTPMGFAPHIHQSPGAPPRPARE